MLFGLLALLIAAAFSGAALYVSFVEHPARAHLDDRAALTEWQPSYKRGAVMQASLSVIGFALGTLAWWQTKNHFFLTGAALLIAPWPWTLAVIRPTNTALLATDPASAGPQSRALLETWGRLHAVRTALGCAATALFLAGLLHGT
jgi:uncharacterized membrane protein